MIRNSRNDNSTLLQLACAIVFILFVFVYVYCFQADLLFMIQHILSGGTTHYDKTIGVFVITIVLYIVQLGMRKLGGLGNIYYALTYIPSLALLAAVTGVDSDFEGNNVFKPLNWFVLILVPLYIVISLLLRSSKKIICNTERSTTLAGILWRNLLIMAGLFMAVCIYGNNDMIFHYRLRIENLLRESSYDKALLIGDKSKDADINLTMLRVYALSRTEQLGERLFEYPLTGGSNALLPDGKKIRCLYYPERMITKNLSIRRKGEMASMDYLLYIQDNGLAMKSVTDYILCGYLLDKNLDAFVSEIRYKYNLTASSLPKHYKEALILYTHLRANPVLVFHNEVLDADYTDFQKLEYNYTDEQERKTRVRDAYGDTYWFYYFYHK